MEEQFRPGLSALWKKKKTCLCEPVTNYAITFSGISKKWCDAFQQILVLIK